MLRLGVLVLGAVVAAAAIASSAHAALFFLFKPTTARSDDLVTVRLGGTPPTFTLDQREKPFQRPIRLYLVRNRIAGEISTRFDPRLHFIGALVPDRNVRGVLTFTVPPLDTDIYVVAAWCPGCAKYSLGRTFSVLSIPRVSRYRDLMGLRVQLPSAKETCPVTIPNGQRPRAAPRVPNFHGNGALWALIPSDGVYSAGTHKIPWYSAVADGELEVQVARLDASAVPFRPTVVPGSPVGWDFSGSSWASRTQLTEGCWRISGRVRDVTLSYVVKVVAD